MANLTAEQEKIIEAFLAGYDLAVEAGAGTGKTFVLVECSKRTKRRGQYMAFNRPLVEEAKAKFPPNVNVSTVHSLARRAIAGPFEPRMRHAKRKTSREVAGILKISGFTVTTFSGEPHYLSAGFLASLTLAGIRRFCQSADQRPEAKHVPYIEGLDAPASAERPTTRDVNRSVAKALEPYLKRAWDDLCRYDGALTFGHEHYLKLWELSGPKLAVDFILFDEAQDASPVMLSIIEQQTCQKVFVGDSCQAIYGFTGAINALDRIRAAGAETLFLTQSFRFGHAVADVANVLLERLRAPLRMTGTPTIPSVVTAISEPDAILTRTNAAAIRAVLDAIKRETTVHLVGGGKEIVSFLKAARTLQNGQRTEHADLACFNSWEEVQEYVEDDEQGQDLRLMVRLIDEFEVDKLLAALDTTIAEEQADLVVSTAHKSKGRQWDRVRLGGDFPVEEKLNADELRLLYVAATRAQLELDVTAIEVLGGVRDREKPRAHEPIEAATRTATVTKLNQHVGQAGDRLDLTLTCTDVGAGKEGKHGLYFPTKLTDEHGRAFTWFGSYELDEGETYRATWTVQRHSEWKGTKETVLTRPRDLEAV